MLKTFQKNSESRKRSQRKRMIVSFAAALLLHLFLLVFVVLGFNISPERRPANQENLFATELILPDEEPETPVENPEMLSQKSYKSEKSKRKFGVSGSPPSSAPPPAARANPGDGSFSQQDSFARRLTRNIDRQSLRESYIRESGRRIGNDGNPMGDDNENDFSVLKDLKRYSYWIKFKQKVENVWRPPRYAQASEMSPTIQTNLRIVIARDGRLELVQVVAPSGFPGFDREAVRAVRAASPYNPFPGSWGEERIDFVMNFVLVVDIYWKKTII